MGNKQLGERDNQKMKEKGGGYVTGARNWWWEANRSMIPIETTDGEFHHKLYCTRRKNASHACD